jgi:hypothetical protein
MQEKEYILVARTLDDDALKFFADKAKVSRRRTPVSKRADSEVRGDQNHHPDIQVKRLAISSQYSLGEDTGGRNDWEGPIVFSTSYRFAGFKQFDPIQLLVNPRKSTKLQEPANSSKNGTNEGEGL